MNSVKSVSFEENVLAYLKQVAEGNNWSFSFTVNFIIKQAAKWRKVAMVLQNIEVEDLGDERQQKLLVPET